MNPDRRRLIISAAGVAVGGMATARLLPEEMLLRDRRPRRSRVAIIAAQEYSESLEGVLVSGLREFHLNLRGRSVLLKPNLVEYIAGVEVNTNPVLVSAAAQAFLKLGADSVVVGEGPGHQRDTYLVLAESGLADQLRSQKISFVDLNRDELFKVPTRATYTGLEHLWLPGTVLKSDFVVSMPKIKTHHWAGVTLSMKNMFGVVPGSKYGWPKNVLHWKGIHRSILDICATVPMHFVIADGVVAMEGNGPLHGTIEVESGWQPHAVSNKGAVGLMQLMPATAVTFGVTNRFEIDQNIRGGVAYLARLLKLFNGDLRLVAAAYLTGETQILRAGLEYSNAEVYKYVAKVARLYQEKRLKRLQTEVRAPNTLQGGSQL